MHSSHLRIRMGQRTSVEIATSGALLTVRAEAVGIEPDGDDKDAADRIRAIAHALLRYADRIDPLWCDEVHAPEEADPSP